MRNRRGPLEIQELPFLERPSDRHAYCLPDEEHYHPDGDMGMEIDDNLYGNEFNRRDAMHFLRNDAIGGAT